MWVIIYGDLNEGIKGVKGLFCSEGEAEEYANDPDENNLGHYETFAYKIDKS